MKLDARQLREANPIEIKEKIKGLERRPLFFILENIYDTYNIGGLFRLADALNIKKIFLCGTCETPPNHKIKKASIGTDKIVPWEYYPTAAEAVAAINNLPRRQAGLTNNNVAIYAVEQTPASIPYTQARYPLPLAFIFGNETTGVTPATLKLAHQTVSIPMFGINKSLNVIIAAAIVSYWTVNQLGNFSGKV